MNFLDVLTDRTGRALASLPFRDRVDLNHHFGLGVGGYSCTTAEVGLLCRKDAR